MALKVDASFFKFVTMGAVAARHVRGMMRDAGLQPIELERYACSNKLWATKIKRLRTPDLLCVRTGLRVEVRAKTKLAIRMSDAPNNPDRRWNSGLRDADMIAFVPTREADGAILPVGGAELFWVRDLLAVERDSRLGPAKSASEGAERDREWPSIVATQGGVVRTVDATRLMVLTAAGRPKTYQLRGKTAYVAVGENFRAEHEFLAGAPPRKGKLPTAGKTVWDPRELLESESAMDRFVAVKALGEIRDKRDSDSLLQVAAADVDPRVRLEAAASLIRMGAGRGLEFLERSIEEPEIEYLRMEAILALAEFEATPLTQSCSQLLQQCATNGEFEGDEVRQAAIWGLGKDGLRDYRAVLQFLNVESDDELIHAVCAVGPDAADEIADSLLTMLTAARSSDRLRASASLLLARTIRSEIAIGRLLAPAVAADQHTKNWALATLGQMNPSDLRRHIDDRRLLAELAPFMLNSPDTNWTKAGELASRLMFVRKQSLG